MKLIKTYKQFIDEYYPEINIGGIILEPNFGDDLYDRIEWYINNPESKSYSVYALNHYIDNILFEFSNITSSSFYEKLRQYQYINEKTENYLSTRDKKLFLSIINDVKSFDFYELSFDVTPFDIDFHSNDYELVFQIFVKVSNPYNNETNERLTLRELSSLMNDPENELHSFAGKVYSKFVKYIKDYYPNLIDNTNMDLWIEMGFFNEKKRPI
jgi:hypothetical protein